MAQVPNKLFSRAQIRTIMTERYNQARTTLSSHIDRSHHPATRELAVKNCAVCAEYYGQMTAFNDLYREFGGRR